MTSHPFYVLCNVTTGTDSEHESLDAALDAVERTVLDAQQWDIHEFLSGSVARCVIGGYGNTASISGDYGDVGWDVASASGQRPCESKAAKTPPA